MLAEFIQLPKECETVGPYALREVLSTSILGVFYQATHKLKHENVLLHILPEALLRADSRFQQKYKETVERQKSLPAGAAMGTVELHQIRGNLIVQYPAGNYKSLNKVILSRKHPMPEERVQHLLGEIGKVLSEALKIEQGHYFLTPDFLFLNEDGMIRIAGIGLFQSIAYECFERFVSGAVMPVSIDKKKSFTALEILSPEIRNFKARDMRSDFYCIGMCAYFMLTGNKPERCWATPTEARRDIGEGWDLLISRCLEAKPTDRFPNYKTFLRDLENINDLASEGGAVEGRKLRRKLNRIPLPQAIENMFSLRNLLLFRLALLGLAGSMAVWTGSVFYEIIFSDLDHEISDTPIRRLVVEDEANLVIKATPRNATVIVKGPNSGRFSPMGEPLYLKGKRGRYLVIVQAPRHRTIQREFEIESSDPVRLTLPLRPDFANLHVNGAIGTEVYIMPKSGFLLHLGTIEESAGLTISNRLLTGRHQLIGLHKSLLPAISDETPMGRAPVEITFKQSARPTELVVVSYPEGATVAVDGVRLGLTPLSIEGMRVGRPLSLRVEKEGYRPVIRELRFEQGERVEINIGELELKVGSLQYRINLNMPNAPDPRELMLSVDGKMRVVSESDTLQLTEGGHLLVLEHPDFFPLREQMVIVDREQTEVDLGLLPRPIQLRVLVQTDRPARFLIDGKELSVNEQGILPVPSNRPVEVEAVIRDYLSVRQSFHGKPNERMEWRVPLRPIPGPKEGQDWSPPYFNLDMVWVGSGTFFMGSPVTEFRRIPNEDSKTKVRLNSGYWIGTHEITQDVWKRVMGENPSQFVGLDLPVDSVTWDSAIVFCQRLTEFERDAGRLPDGWVYRLPTEAEWEYAARAGTETPFSFGELASPEDGNFHGLYQPGKTFGEQGEERYGTRPVGSFSPNPLGLYDVHGNVGEWTIDRYWDRHPGGQVENPVNFKSGRGYTVKGGSWKDTADRVRSAAREGVPGTSVRNSLGLRVVLAPSVIE